MMQDALNACMDNFEALVAGENVAIEKLMHALITAGLSMEKCGNSRPASGSEHHVSHFLEMDFARRGEKIPLHGVKVALGTLLSITIYRYLKDNQIAFQGDEAVYRLVDLLPRVEAVEEMLEKLGCPTRFSKIGVRKETLEDAIENAYTVRDRYTVLTLAHELGLTEKLKPLLIARFY
jgi:glycerol-1-phosphate dehydrogenase [NAD(P)+]